MIKKITKLKIRWVIAIILLIIVFIIAKNLSDDSINGFDSLIYGFISPTISPFYTSVYKFITNLVSVKFLVIVCLLLIILIKRKMYNIFIILNLFNTITINTILKNIFSRERPIELMLIEESGFSFPSGHSMVSMSFYGFLIYLIWQTKIERRLKIIISILLGLIIITIDISRIYLGVHYASDVIGGFCISLIYLIFFTYLFSKIIKKDKDSINNN